MFKNRIKLFLSAAFLLCFAACNDTDTPASPCSISFDQEGLFTNVADNLIIPGYQELAADVEALSKAADAFTNAPSLSGLTELQSSWREAYLNWQTVAQYEFGPAESVQLRSMVNPYPANIEQIEQNLAAGSWNLEAAETYDKGFPALDYLLFGTGDDEQAIVDYFQANMSARDYVGDIVRQISDKTAAALQGWTQDGYRDQFITNTGSAAGSSLSLIINNLNQFYETIKRDKIGVPSGVLTLGFTNPQKVEAYYSGRSLELARAALNASLDLYKGKNGVGLDDYLLKVEAEKNGESLNGIILAQYQAAAAALNALDGKLSEKVDTETDQVINAYNELTKQVVNLKTDMPSVLCIAITYVDNPSDSD